MSYKLEIVRAVRIATHSLAQQRVIGAVERGSLKPDQFERYAVQRYKAAHMFSRLLEAGIAKAQSANLRILQKRIE